MGVFQNFSNNLLDRLADRLGDHVQGVTQSQRHRDVADKGDTYSVEAEISEALADLILMFSSVPVAGESERAQWLDDRASDFFQTQAKSMVASTFMTGDCLIVPSWNGRNIQNAIIPSGDFVITGCYGNEITSCAYVIDRKKKNGETYSLMQAVELVPYSTASGMAYANRYRVFAARNDSLVGASIDQFPDWKERYKDAEWYIPNVDRLLVARLKSHAINPNDPNSVKGVPICFGAGAAIAEIHYLLHQMHVEFGASEKFILADKRMFRKEWHGDEVRTVLPRGKDRVIMDVSGIGDVGGVTEWAPDIRYQAYLEALDKQEQLVERAVGVSGGILSRPNDMNYQNVDNVRKSQQKTMAFVETSRRSIEKSIKDLLYVWNVLANYYTINPIGDYDVTFDWSDEYVETFADRQNALLAGEAIGATDAVDYRMYVMGEAPETARERVEEIQSQRGSSIMEQFEAA